MLLFIEHSGKAGGGKVSVKLTVTGLDFLSQGGETIPRELESILIQRSVALLSSRGSLIYIQGSCSQQGEPVGGAVAPRQPGSRWVQAGIVGLQHFLLSIP